MAIGRVIGLWRHPVKSMAAEPLTIGDVGDEGIVGDRRFGVVETESGKLLSAKRHPQLLNLRPVRRDDGEVLIYDPASAVTASDDPEIDAWLSDRLGFSVSLVRVAPEQRRTVEMDTDDGVLEFDTQPGSFFDGRSTVHVITTASLATASAHYRDGAWERERFRPGILIETDGVGAGDWPEDGWVGREIDLGGPAGVRLRVQKLTRRCVMVTRAQERLPEDREILRTLARVHDANLGVGCVVSGIGRVAVGDDVTFRS